MVGSIPKKNSKRIGVSAAVEEIGTTSLAAVEEIGNSSLAAVDLVGSDHLAMHRVGSPKQERRDHRGIVMRFQGVLRIDPLVQEGPATRATTEHRAATVTNEAIARHAVKVNLIEATDRRDARDNSMPHARSHTTEHTTPTTSTYTLIARILDLRRNHLVRAMKREGLNVKRDHSVFSTEQTHQPHTHPDLDGFRQTSPASSRDGRMMRLLEERGQSALGVCLSADLIHYPTLQQLPSLFMDSLASPLL
jgi:hypothetical protein